jgi:hypothetical protein
MATLSAMVHNPAIRQFRARLRVAGKLPKVVLVACMRKLLTGAGHPGVPVAPPRTKAAPISQREQAD